MSSTFAVRSVDSIPSVLFACFQSTAFARHAHYALTSLQFYLLPLFLAHLLDVQVSVDHTEHVEVLPLVLVDTLDLDVVQSIGGHLDASDLLHTQTDIPSVKHNLREIE